MTDLLKRLGDNWHNDHPYLGIIEDVVPSCPHALTIEQKLIEVYVEEHNNFKLYKNTTGFTLYDSEIENCKAEKKNLEQEREKEEERFKKLIEKFKKLNPPESGSDQDNQEEEEEEEEEEVVEEKDVVVKAKGKGQQVCKRTLKKEEERKKGLVAGIKSSMATSQGKLMEIGERIEELDKICEYYAHYSYATRGFVLSMRKLALAYSETKDVAALIKGLAELIPYYEHMMRRYVPTEPCEGEKKGLCGTHLLPLHCTIYPNQGYKHVWKCAVSP